MRHRSNATSVVFPSSQVLLLKTDDLLARRAETVGRVLEFIGVDSTSTCASISRPTGAARNSRKPAHSHSRADRDPGVLFHHRFDGVFGNY